MTNQERKPYVLYHAQCADGTAAAWAAWKHLGNYATYIGLTHGGNMPELRSDTVLYMVDFSFKRHILLELAKKHPKIVILDHHRSAQKDLEGISEEAPNIEVVFDMERSGAVIAWEYFHQRPVPELLKYIQDRDLWRFNLPCSREVSAAVYSYPMTIFEMDMLVRTDIDDLVGEGQTLVRQERKNVESVCEDPQGCWIEGHFVPAVNANYFIASECGHQLLKNHPEAPFAAVYRIAGNGSLHWSLRSEDSRVDVSEIAAKLGGGGHRCAAGFRTEPHYQWPTFTFRHSYKDAMKDREKGYAEKEHVDA